MKKVLFLSFLLSGQYTAFTQQGSLNSQPQTRKRFINKVEVFAGPSLSFNHGNKFIENYSDPIIQNKRLLKVGYSFGVGVYHSINKRLEINARVTWEQKGTKAELNHPLGNDRQTIVSEYSYEYTTISVAPGFALGKKEKITLSFGVYYAIISGVKGQEIYSDPSGDASVYNNFVGRNWNVIDPDGAIRNFTFIPGLQSFETHDYGIILGLSYKIPITDRHSILIQLVDNYGLQNIYNNTNVENLLEKNHALSIILGYQFNRAT